MNISIQEADKKYPWLVKYFPEKEESKSPLFSKSLSCKKVSEITIVDSLNTGMRPKRINYFSLISQFIWEEKDDFEKILLLDNNGEKLLRVGEFHHLSNLMPRRWIKPEMHTYFDPNEIIDEAILRVPDEKEVRYVLNVSTYTLYIL